MRKQIAAVENKGDKEFHILDEIDDGSYNAKRSFWMCETLKSCWSFELEGASMRVNRNSWRVFLT